jgi:hypothetical protein
VVIIDWIAAAAAAIAAAQQDTAWNAMFAQGKPINTPMFDTDSDPATLSDAERRLIIAVWRTVAEYCVIWEVDVTTEDPGFQRLER